MSLIILAAFQAHAETLEQAWTAAYEANPSLAAQRARLRAVDEQVSVALSNWRPSIEANGSIGKTRQITPDQGPFVNNNFSGTARSYGVQVTQPVFRGFRTLAETKEAKKQVLAERAQLQDTEQTLFLDVATAYLDVLRDQNILDCTRENTNVLQQKLEETRIRFEHGDLTQTDVHQAESRLARMRVSEFQAENRLSADRAHYVQLTGNTPQSLDTPKIPPDSAIQLDQLLHIAETQNPTVIQAQHSMEAADAEIDRNEGTLLPEVNLVGSSTRSWDQNFSLPGREDSSQVLLQATIPLYKSGADYARTRAAEQTYTQRQMELDDARHKARETAMNSWQAMRSAQDALGADEQEVEAANQALEGVKVESKVGTRTTLDVLNAQQELLDAQIDYAKSRHDRDLALLQIKSVIGQLTADHLKLAVKPYDPKLHYNDARKQWVGFSEDNARYAVDHADPKAP